MGPMKIASAHKQVYKIFKKGHELFLNQNLGHTAKKFGNYWPIRFLLIRNCSFINTIGKKIVIEV